MRRRRAAGSTRLACALRGRFFCFLVSGRAGGCVRYGGFSRPRARCGLFTTAEESQTGRGPARAPVSAMQGSWLDNLQAAFATLLRTRSSSDPAAAWRPFTTNGSSGPPGWLGPPTRRSGPRYRRTPTFVPLREAACRPPNSSRPRGSIASKARLDGVEPSLVLDPQYPNIELKTEQIAERRLCTRYAEFIAGIAFSWPLGHV